MKEGPNFAEFQRRLDAGELTLEECRRHGSTHRAYGWACNPPPQFSPMQVEAYKTGHEGLPL